MKRLVVLLFVVVAMVVSVVGVSAQESEWPTQEELLAGDYVGTLTFWASLSGLGPDGGVASYDASGSGPVSMMLSETLAVSGTWENHFDSVAVFGQQGGTVTAVNEMHDEGTVEGVLPPYPMYGTQTGTSKVTVESGALDLVRDISLDPQSFGPIDLSPTFIDCNQLWFTFAPAVDESAAGIGWKRRAITGSIMVVPVNVDETELPLSVQEVNRVVRQAMRDLFAWAAAAESAAAAGEQPDIRPAQGPISELEWANSKLDAVARCLEGKAKDQALWRSQVTDAIRDILSDILAHSPADVTFTPSTLNDMATVGARAAAFGEGAADTSGQLASSIQSVGLARLHARVGGG
jgi:hypothetical protein